MDGFSLHGWRLIAIPAILLSLLGIGTVYLTGVGPLPATQIFQGITYGADWLEPSEEGRGLFHWVRVDLKTPGIELYITPLDTTAVAEGWQYQLRRIETVVAQERLSIAVNGTLFTSQSRWLRSAGDLARSVETVVSDHAVGTLWEHTYLLWFDDQLNPHLQPTKPPSPSELAGAKWGIGGQAVWLLNGKIWPGSDRTPNARTGVAIDAAQKILFLAVSEFISPRLMLERLAALGAKSGMLLDGGSSSALAIGAGSDGVSPGVKSGGSRAVATFLGVRAKPLSAAR